MFIIANFLTAAAEVLNIVITVFSWLIIAGALISWVNPDPGNPVVVFLRRATEPFLNVFRRIIPGFGSGMDLAPVWALLFLYFTRYFLIQTLMDIAIRLKRGA